MKTSLWRLPEAFFLDRVRGVADGGAQLGHKPDVQYVSNSRSATTSPSSV